MSNRAFVATEILDERFGSRDYNEVLGDKVADAYDFAMERYADYGFPEDERGEFVLRQISNTIWNFYTGGDSCYAAAKRIMEAWGHAGL